MQPTGAKAPANPPQTPFLNELRRRVRHKVHTPAYSSVDSSDSGMVLDLSEILDISEDGMAIQTSAPLEVNSNLNLCLDLSETKAYIHTRGQVIWADGAGRVGICFPEMEEASRHQLKQWLFVNALTACDRNLAAEPAEALESLLQIPAEDFVGEPQVTPDYTSILGALTAVKREVQAIGTNLDASLYLVAERSLAFLRASGAAIALLQGSEMICRTRAGPDAPPVGARVQVGSGFSGECVRTRTLLRCDDSETDPRVDRQTCRALEIRSLIAIPIQVGESVVGLLELFSRQPKAFTADDHVVLRHLAEAATMAVDSAARVPGEISVADEQPVQPEPSLEILPPASTSWVREHLGIIVTAMVVFILLSIFLVVEMRTSSGTSAVTSSTAASTQPLPADRQKKPSDTTSLEALSRLATEGDAAAAFAMGANYATGEVVKQNYAEAVRWFTMAAESGHVVAQATLGAYYWAGRGVAPDLTKAYFWSILAQAGGDQASKYRVTVLTSRLSHSQILAAQEDANRWLRQHRVNLNKPSPARQ